MYGLSVIAYSMANFLVPVATVLKLVLLANAPPFNPKVIPGSAVPQKLSGSERH